jgi:hypothetical protein
MVAIGGAYNPKYIPKGWRSATAEAGHYFLAFEKDNPGLFDEKNDKYYVSKRRARVFKPMMPLVVTDQLGAKKTQIVGVTIAFINLGVAEVSMMSNSSTLRITGGRKPTRGRKRKTRKRD